MSLNNQGDNRVSLLVPVSDRKVLVDIDMSIFGFSRGSGLAWDVLANTMVPYRVDHGGRVDTKRKIRARANYMSDLRTNRERLGVQYIQRRI